MKSEVVAIDFIQGLSTHGIYCEVWRTMRIPHVHKDSTSNNYRLTRSSFYRAQRAQAALFEKGQTR